MISGPMFFVAAPLLAALIGGGMSRLRRATAGWCLLVALALWLGLQAMPAAEQTAVIWGRTYLFTAGVRALFLLLYAGLALLSGLLLIFPQGRKLAPGSLAVLALLLLALISRPWSAGALFLALALVVAALAAQDDGAGKVQGSLRYLALAVLALPLFLVAAWYVETQPGATAVTAHRLLLLGGLMWLATFPFHVGATSLVRETAPPAWLLLLALAHLAIVTFVLAQRAALPAAADPALTRLVLLAAMVTLLVAALLLATAVTPARLVNGLLLGDLAAVTVALALPPAAGWPAAVALLMARFGSLLLLGGGWLMLRRATAAWAGNGTLLAHAGLGRRAPWGLALFLLGCLSLLGLPLTLGFGGRWAVVQAAVVHNPAGGLAWWTAVGLLAVMGVGVLVLLRWLRLFVAAPAGEPAPETACLPETRPWQIGAALAIFLATAVALLPHLYLAYAARLVAAFGG